ncbi:glycosyltransferase [Natrinema limicola]|uniref:Group 1 glycosyl transferase n=1 Tax=Natrinema limicola JCM 13563 TaxID=1230457 RepID=M0C6Y6_9EURY|nr:glycosyltransferase [Natrinema limicola]ELZ17699.1 group 1 glycosyl transferase [Natrinema limicola JCM 13563]
MTDLRILWLTPDKPDEISVGRERIADHLETAGHDVTLRGTTARTIARSLRDRGRFDIVVGTTRLGAIAGVVVSRVHGVPLVVDHIDPIRQLRATEPDAVVRTVRRLEHLAFRLAAHVLYVYPEEESRLDGRATATSKTDLGVEYERFADPDPAVVERTRERLGTVPNKLAVYIGGLEPMYEIEALLEAADELDDWTLLVIGAGSLEPSVEREAADSESIRFLGTVPHKEVPGYLHFADVGVSLVDDPYTLKILEYGAAGLNVVQRAGRAESRFGGLVEYCSTEPASIRAAVERASDGTRGEALQQYVRKFSWNTIADDYRRAIEVIPLDRTDHPRV